jgi:beta-hydroxylase
MDITPLEPRHWVLLTFLASGLYIHLRGKVRFETKRMLDFTIVLAPINALMYLFSRVPKTAYLDPASFPELKVLQEHWQEIREEALRLSDEGAIRAANAYNDIGFNSFFRTGWTRFYLSWYGKDLPSAQALAPRTAALLKGLPSVKAAMFASLPPGAHLQRHRDPYAGSLRYHLGLITPDDKAHCFIEVDGQRYSWKDGEAVMFDETYIHHAQNSTKAQRIILFCDIERPLAFAPVRAFNRLFARHIMAAASSQNTEVESVGVINRVFGQIYKVRLAAKRVKTSNKTLYYFGKWLLIGGLLWALFW